MDNRLKLTEETLNQIIDQEARKLVGTCLKRIEIPIDIKIKEGKEIILNKEKYQPHAIPEINIKRFKIPKSIKVFNVPLRTNLANWKRVKIFSLNKEIIKRNKIPKIGRLMGNVFIIKER